MGRLGVGRVLENGFPSRSGIGKFHGASDKRAQHLLAPGLGDLFKDLPPMRSPAIV